jgi:predicted transcriptional regulator of viral defense system
MKTIDIIKAINRTGRRIFSAADIAKLTGSNNANTIYKTVERLSKNGILSKLNKGLYFTAATPPDLFEIANGLYVPSYVSLESALYRYGVISQAPYTITSVSTNRSKKKTALNNEFEYTHLNPKYFFGYVRDRDILIASREKALLDLLYLVSKKSRPFNFDGIDWKAINRKEFKVYTQKYSFLPLQNLIKRIGL